MKKSLLLFLLLPFCAAQLFLSSCATIMNEKTINLTLHSEVPATVTLETDTFYVDKGSPHFISVKRNNKHLLFQVRSDSLYNVSQIRWKYDKNFQWGLLTVYYGIADYFMGLRNKKIYDYDRLWMIDKDLNFIKFSDYYFTKQVKSNRRGDLYLDLSFPYINQFTYLPDKEKRKSGAGFLGIRTGLDYYYQKNRFFSANASAVMNYEIPFPVGICYFSNYTIERFYSSFVELTHNHRIKNFSFGYGLAGGWNEWSFEKCNYNYYGEHIDAYKSRSSQFLGNVFTANYFFNESFYTGIIYRPSYIRFGTDKRFAYEHLLSFNFGFKIRLKKGAKSD